MNIFNHKCSHCGVHLELDKDDLLTFCPYCGCKLDFDYEPDSDEAEPSFIKTKQIKNRMINIKTGSVYLQSSIQWINENKVFAYTILGVLGFILFLILMISLLTTKSTIPFSQNYANKKQYSTLLTALDNSGFYYYSIIPVSDEEYADEYKDGQVIEVLVNGKSKYSTKKRFKTDKVNILIQFYSPDGKIGLPISSRGVHGQDERDIEKMLKTHGFSNISETRKENLLGKLVYDDWEITSIRINGEWSFEKGDRLDPDTPINIEYYLR